MVGDKEELGIAKIIIFSLFRSTSKLALMRILRKTRKIYFDFKWMKCKRMESFAYY